MKPPVVVWEGEIGGLPARHRVVLFEPEIGETDAEGRPTAPACSVERQVCDSMGAAVWVPTEGGWPTAEARAQALCSLWRIARPS